MFKNTVQVASFLSMLTISLGMSLPVESEGEVVNQDINTKGDSSTKDKVTESKKKAKEETTSKASGIVKTNLNFRKGPSTNDEIIGVHEKEEELRILSKSDGWYKVQNSEGKTGWSHGKYIEESDKEATWLSDTNGSLKSNANVRKEPSTGTKVINILKKGQEIRVLSSSNGWYKVQCSDGTIGWTHGSHIESSVPLESSSSSSSSSNSKTSSEEISTNSSNSSKSQMVVKATAYSGHTITATGTTPKWGTIAVDPSIIPYGTKVYIPRFGKVFTAEDCGGGIKGNRIDIFMNSESDCYNWGVRSITIEILD